jgi:response regulator RpfG family c-di-GMP phosphodiesterase
MARIGRRGHGGAAGRRGRTVMATNGRARVLVVDDEANLLASVARVLRNSQFDVRTCERPREALDLLAHDVRYAVVVSDLRMQEMDGVTLLRQARTISPDTVRVLLTGQLDLAHAIGAVNQGEIFRFLTKPCPPVVLTGTLTAAAEQYRLITSERILLEQTLQGCIRALVDMLALVAPAALGRAVRVQRAVTDVARACGLQDAWKSEMAALLSQLGSVILPPETLARLLRGDDLTDDEIAMVRRTPATLEQVLCNIPRLEPVLEILRELDPLPNQTPSRETIPWGARAIRIAIDLDVLETQGHPLARAVEVLRKRTGRYDTEIVEVFAQVYKVQRCERVLDLALDQLKPGMTLINDVHNRSGILLVARGCAVTPSLIEPLKNLTLGAALPKPVRVAVPMLEELPALV